MKVDDMQHILAIISYKMTHALKCTVDLLKNDMDIVIHVDAKSDIKQYDSIKEFVTFTEERIDVRWGHYSRILAMLVLLKYMKSKEKYHYISIISESDIPLKTGKEINTFLTLHKGKEFIGMVSNEQMSDFEYDKLKYNYPDFCFSKRGIFKKIYRGTKVYRFFKNARYYSLPPLRKGSQWFTISREFTDWIIGYLDKHPDYQEAFCHSYCGDELFFQTLLAISPFQERVMNNKDDCLMGGRYIIWEADKTSPCDLFAEKVLEYRKEAESALFFRKVSEESDFDVYMHLLNKL
ncbi:TPA: beta-1,6-N-acetylglucosaminyltransferase [Streptococcus agalactiae]